MAYSKPKTLAKSAKKASFVAGCPPKRGSAAGASYCKSCEMSQ